MATAQETVANQQVVRGTAGSPLWRDSSPVPDYLRFYSDGTVIGVNAIGTPGEIASWFKAPYSFFGHYSISGSCCHTNLKGWEGTNDYEGVVQGSALQLNVFSHLGNQHIKQYYELVPPDEAQVTTTLPQRSITSPKSTAAQDKAVQDAHSRAAKAGDYELLKDNSELSLHIEAEMTLLDQSPQCDGDARGKLTGFWIGSRQLELDTPDIVHHADKAWVVTKRYGRVRIACGYGGLCVWLTPSQKTNQRKLLDK